MNAEAAARRTALQEALRELRAANIRLANARDVLFGLPDAGFVLGELTDAKAALQVTITHASRQLHREFPDA